jgi:hypothetical protein
VIFSRNGEFDVVTRVTGPHHHYLGLVLRSDRGTALAEVEDLSASPETGSVDLARVERLRSEVSRGIAAANEQLGTNYQASRIRFCSADPSLKDVYRTLAKHLVQHVARSRDGDGGGLETSESGTPVHSRPES